MQGCRLRDHVVKLSSDSKKSEENAVYSDLLAHRDVVCLPHLRLGAAAALANEYNAHTAHPSLTNRNLTMCPLIRSMGPEALCFHVVFIEISSKGPLNGL